MKAMAQIIIQSLVSPDANLCPLMYYVVTHICTRGGASLNYLSYVANWWNVCIYSVVYVYVCVVGTVYNAV